jgi:hypothetical protein
MTTSPIDFDLEGARSVGAVTSQKIPWSIVLQSEEQSSESVQRLRGTADAPGEEHL